VWNPKSPTTGDYSELILKFESGRDPSAPANLLVGFFLEVVKVNTIKRLHLIPKLRPEKSMLVNSAPDAPSHIRLHLMGHFLVKFVRVDRRHQDHTIHLKVILSVVTVIPNFGLPFLVEPDQSIVHSEGT